jgi:hypothetical protein
VAFGVASLGEDVAEGRSVAERYVVRREIMTDDELREAGWDLDESRRAPHPNMRTVHAYAAMRGGQERPVAHFELHSEEFEFGFGGSGPTELARCLLIDWFGLQDAATSDPARVEMPVDYGAFKRRFVASVSQDEHTFSIDADAIQAWVDEQQEESA